MADSNINVKISADSSQATAAINKVANTLSSELPKGVQEASNKVAKEAASIRAEIKSIVAQMNKGLQFAGAVTGIGLAANAVKDVAVAAAQTADQLTSIRSRINLINDGSQTTAEIMDKIYSAATRSRGSYIDMADSVAKLNMLAKDAFSSNDEAIYFVEQLNKQFKISGAGIQEASAAMYQLTQAMASGKLQGDEFRSIMENAPLLAQSIAKEMGMSVGQLKEMSSQGLITADIIKSALFNAAEETDARFGEIPMTFAEVGQSVQNQLIQAFQPVLEQLSTLPQSGEFQAFIEGVGIAIRGLAAAAQGSIGLISAAFAGLRIAISTISQTVRSFGSLFISTMPKISAAVLAVVVAFASYRAAIALCSAQTAALTVKVVAYRVAELASAAATKIHAAAMVVLRAAMAGTATVSAVLTALMVGLRGAYIAVRSGALAAAVAQRVLNAVMKANPVGLLVSVVLTLVTVFATAAAASNGFGATLSSVFSTIVHTAVWGVNKIIDALNWLIAKLNSVGDKVAKFFGGTFTAIAQVDTISADTAQSIVNTAGDMASQIASGLSGGGGSDLDVGGGGGGDTGGGGSGKGGKGGGGKGSAGKDLEKEAKQVHEKILQSYLEMLGNKQELLELEYKKELDELDKSKAANANYQQDLELLNAVYAEKRIKAKQEEMAKMREIENNVRDMRKDLELSLAVKDSTGQASPMVQFTKEYTDAIDAISDKWDKYSDDFVQMDKMQQQHFIDTLKERGILFEMTEDGRVDFEKQKTEELLAVHRDYNDKYLELQRTMAEEKWNIDEAMRTQNFEALQSALNDEYVATQQNYDLRKNLLSEYQQAVMDSHWNTQQLLFDALNAGIDSMQSGISSLIQGTTTLTSAIQNIGKAMLKAVADFVANWIAAMVKKAVFGKMLQSQETTASIAAAQAQLPAWSALAQQMSMATFGASAATGMAAWSSSTAAGTAASAALGAVGNFGGSFGAAFSAKSMPALAEGGLAYGTTIAQIGEGKYQEAVLPLSDTVFDRLGEGINRSNGGMGAGGGITLNVSAIDAESFGSFLETRGGRALRQFLVNQDREFIGTEGTW
ncbi:tape measure protein [Veillonella nakazawae]|nr:tape measure protein [Veillonella nakazawae]MDK7739972.1 tape measure protein [Veillonella nakazawae]